MLRILKSSRFIKFCLVGVLNTGLNYSVFYILLALQGNALLAGSIGFTAGAVLGFILNRKYTFSSNITFGTGMKKYLLVQLVCLCLHFMVQSFFLYILFFPKDISQIPSIFATAFLNYYLSNKLIFNKLIRKSTIVT